MTTPIFSMPALKHFLDDNRQCRLGDTVSIDEGLQGEGALVAARGGDKCLFNFHGAQSPEPECNGQAMAFSRCRELLSGRWERQESIQCLPNLGRRHLRNQIRVTAVRSRVPLVRAVRCDLAVPAPAHIPIE